ncbi:MAG: AAA family ATPase [Pseudomonadota bacterium]
MKRKFIEDLISWKNQKMRKPLLVYGARQTGKTYIIEQFGKNEFPQCHVFNFEKNKQIKTIFEKDLEPKRILSELSFIAGSTINPESDFIFFDEIQECQAAITSLKYFCEGLPQLAICGAGSLLGVKLSNHSMPVGKVEILHLYPMTFEEYLMATQDQNILSAFQSVAHGEEIPGIAHQKLLDYMYEYFICGGMPQAVLTYLDNRDDPYKAFTLARKIQNDILQMYQADFAKHSGKINSMHLIAVFENMSSQLASHYDDSTQRYKFKDVIPGKNSYRDFEGPLQWLCEASLIIKVKICNRAEIPLKAFTKNNIFKGYFFDIGILGAQLELRPDDIQSNDYGITKGYFAENFVAQELLATYPGQIYSWAEKNSEIEFLLQGENEGIIPIEVKAGHRTQAKSLQNYLKKYSPALAYVFSTRPRSSSKDNSLQYVPLYLCGKTLKTGGG